MSRSSRELMAWIEANPEIHENLEKIKAAVENGKDFDEMEEQLVEMTRKLGAAGAGQWIARRERESFKEAKESGARKHSKKNGVS